MKIKSFFLCRKRFPFKFPDEILVSDESTIYRLLKKIGKQICRNQKNKQKWTVLNEEMSDRLSLENSRQKSLKILKKQKQISLYSAFRTTNHQYSMTH
jgi:hypothetical protein